MAIASYVHTGSLYTSGKAQHTRLCSKVRVLRGGAGPLEFLWSVYARTQENGNISLYQGVLSLENMVYTA